MRSGPSIAFKIQGWPPRTILLGRGWLGPSGIWARYRSIRPITLPWARAERFLPVTALSNAHWKAFVIGAATAGVLQGRTTPAANGSNGNLATSRRDTI